MRGRSSFAERMLMGHSGQGVASRPSSDRIATPWRRSLAARRHASMHGQLHCSQKNFTAGILHACACMPEVDKFGPGAPRPASYVQSCHACSYCTTNRIVLRASWTHASDMHVLCSMVVRIRCRRHGSPLFPSTPPASPSSPCAVTSLVMRRSILDGGPAVVTPIATQAAQQLRATYAFRASHPSMPVEKAAIEAANAAVPSLRCSGSAHNQRLLSKREKPVRGGGER